MCAVKRIFETKLFYPSMKDSVVLPGWNVLVSSDPRPKQEVFTVQIAKLYQCSNSFSCPFGYLELHRATDFCCTSVALLETELPYATSYTLSLTRSQPRSLLSRAILNRAKSRVLPSSSNRIRILKIWDVWSGLFWPMIRSLFHGDVFILKSSAMWEIWVWLFLMSEELKLSSSLKKAIAEQIDRLLLMHVILNKWIFLCFILQAVQL